jgi:hypothetical protein
MSTQHTQGPWKVVDSWDDYTIEGPNSEEIIFQDGPYGTPTIKEANACLIAAAPDLLEALLECLPHLERDDQHIDAAGWLMPHYTKARAAIDKATGEIK